MTDRRLSEDEVKAFVRGHALDCFDPKLKARIATIEYFENGTCHAEFADGTSDDGRYGFDSDVYWTQYTWFREGGLYRFFLVKIDDLVCQAYFEDGTKAFLQRVCQ